MAASLSLPSAMLRPPLSSTSSSLIHMHQLPFLLSSPSTRCIYNKLTKCSSRPRFFMSFANQSSIAQEIQQSDNSVELAASLEKVEVLDLNGKSIFVTDLWENRKVVIGFTRHFGCVLCMKRANLLASKKAEMDASNVGLIIIGPGTLEQDFCCLKSMIEKARGFVRNTNFPGEVYADPCYSTYKALDFASGVSTTFTPVTGKRLISAYLEGYRQDWHLSFQKDTVSKGNKVESLSLDLEKAIYHFYSRMSKQAMSQIWMT